MKVIFKKEPLSFRDFLSKKGSGYFIQLLEFPILFFDGIRIGRYDEESETIYMTEGQYYEYGEGLEKLISCYELCSYIIRTSSSTSKNIKEITLIVG